MRNPNFWESSYPMPFPASSGAPQTPAIPLSCHRMRMDPWLQLKVPYLGRNSRYPTGVSRPRRGASRWGGMADVVPGRLENRRFAAGNPSPEPMGLHQATCNSLAMWNSFKGPAQRHLRSWHAPEPRVQIPKSMPGQGQPADEQTPVLNTFR